MVKKYVKKINTAEIKKKAKKVHEKSFLQESHFLYILFANIFLIIIALAYLVTNVKTGQDLQPIKYNYFFGIVETGSWLEAYFLPTLVIIVTVANILLAEYFYKRDKFLTYVFVSVNFLFAVLVIIQSIALNQKGI